jgi:hypothetical protein
MQLQIPNFSDPPTQALTPSLAYINIIINNGKKDQTKLTQRRKRSQTQKQNLQTSSQIHGGIRHHLQETAQRNKKQTKESRSPLQTKLRQEPDPNEGKKGKKKPACLATSKTHHNRGQTGRRGGICGRI